MDVVRLDDFVRRAECPAVSIGPRPPATESSMVILPYLTGCRRRTYAAIFSFIAGVMPPMPMFGRSLL
ncbi:hypothetical protein SAMN04488523_103322 [Sulfitobacter brevis]|uniref:Uncharacterized protein n=1 Tax=Sulfitobacter brevis TaxID=74348 RepID=A0A1I1W7F5_9RHOB|nr:hypothetical protein SAMN04488523_103322 [Sulfitobacter brevis]